MAEQSNVSAVLGDGALGADQPAAIGAELASRSTEEDEDSEWEYEYSSTETEVRSKHPSCRHLARLTFADLLPDCRALLS